MSKKIIIGIIVLAVVGLVVFVQSGDESVYENEDGTVMEKTGESMMEDKNDGAMMDDKGAGSMMEKGVYAMSEVALHNNASSCWSAINSNVYDLTNWIGSHPGGAEAITALCGVDGTAAFNGVHGGKQPQEDTLATFKIGVLK